MRLEMDPANRMEVETDSGRAAFLERYTSRVEELKRRIAVDPAVAGVTVAAELPLMEQRSSIRNKKVGPSASWIGAAPRQ